MSKIKNLFSTPKKAVISSTFVAAVLVISIVGTSFVASAANEKKAIGAEKAETLAFADAGVLSADVVKKKTDFDFEKGTYVYEVDFVSQGIEYDYVIDSVSGKVIFKTSEKADSDEVISTKSITTVAKSEEIKTTKTAPQVTTKAEITTSKVQAVEKSTTQKANTNGLITVEEAKVKALAHAVVKKADAVFTKAYLDTDDGVKVYDVEFRTSDKEFEYEINAKTGKIIESDVENIRKVVNTTTKAVTTKDRTEIGVDKAKSIALSHSGCNESQVKFSKVKLEFDDGMKVYEIEFYKGLVEYEYTINASNGKIIEFDKDTDID